MKSPTNSPSHRSSNHRSSNEWTISMRDLIGLTLTFCFAFVLYNTVGTLNLHTSQHAVNGGGTKLRHHTDKILSHLEQIRTLAEAGKNKDDGRSAERFKAMTFNDVRSQKRNIVDDEGEEPVHKNGMAEKFCCKALTAECVSCSLGQTKEKFCSEHKDYLGCESGTGNNKETGSKVNVESTIDNNDKKNDDSNNESKNNNDKKKKNSNDNSGKQYTTINNNNNNNNNTEMNNNKDDAKISKSTNGEIFPPAKKSFDSFAAFCSVAECNCYSDIKKGNPTFFGVRPSNLCPGELKTTNHSFRKGKYAYVSLYVGPSVGGRGADACHKIGMCHKSEAKEDTLVTMLKVLRHSLRHNGVSYPFVVLVPEGTSQEDLLPFKRSGIITRVVAPLAPPSDVSSTDEKKFHKQSYTKLATFSLYEYEKVIYLDADMIVGRNLDFLFEAETPAFIVQNKIKFAGTGGNELKRISAPMHAGLMVIEPSKKFFNKILEKIPHIESFDGGDTGFMWSFLPMYYELPQDVVRIKYSQATKLIGEAYHVLHFTGNKPLTCGRGMDCNRNHGDYKMANFYAPKWHKLWWAWHDHMVLENDLKSGAGECRDDVAQSITDSLSQENFCFDGMGNLGTLVKVQCNQNDKTKYMLEFRNQHFLTGTCEENGNGPSQKDFLAQIKGLFGGVDIMDGKVSKENFKRTLIEIERSKLASFIDTRTIKKPDSMKFEPPIMFWWETEKGKEVSTATSRIMHAAIKSAILHGKHGTRVLIFSNSLPSDFFCESSKLTGWEAKKALPFTCRAVVMKYSVKELMGTIPTQLEGISQTMKKVKDASDDNKGYMHTMSDVVRFALLYYYGGTYMDFDQIFIRPLPEDKMPLISREMQWRRSQCNKNSTDCQTNPDTCFAKTSYCQEIGVDGAVPAQYGNPPLPNDNAADGLVFSLYSGLLAGFPPCSDLIFTFVEMIPQQYQKFCWGCLGPNLVTKGFSWMAKQNKLPPAFTLSSNDLLMIKHNWRKDAFSKDEFIKNKGAVIDIDFHSSKAPKSMLAELTKMTLFASNGYKPHGTLLDLVNDEEYKKTTAKDGEGGEAHIESKEFAKLPWMQR